MTRKEREYRDEQITDFRYRLVAELTNPYLSAAQRRALIQQKAGVEHDFVDLRDHPLPHCDGGTCYSEPAVTEFKAKLIEADGYLIATPIYNFDANSVLKNAVELTGKDVWTEKVVGFLAAAGGRGSYMSLSGITLSLMLDFRTFCLPRFIYVTAEDFGEDREQFL